MLSTIVITVHMHVFFSRCRFQPNRQNGQTPSSAQYNSYEVKHNASIRLLDHVSGCKNPSCIYDSFNATLYILENEIRYSNHI
mmetsp:Transcript_2159/g.2770  ORF Transcript_2159/g.2770 Transcript_2159/m.2770 type:complete len:83 (+) Transcript_2159:565-813(+)